MAYAARHVLPRTAARRNKATRLVLSITCIVVVLVLLRYNIASRGAIPSVVQQNRGSNDGSKAPASVGEVVALDPAELVTSPASTSPLPHIDGDVTVEPQTIVAMPSGVAHAEADRQSSPWGQARYCNAPGVQRRAAGQMIPVVTLPSKDAPSPAAVKAEEWDGRAYSLAFEGAQPLQDIRTSQALDPVRMLGGWHCVVARDNIRGCIDAATPFVVTEESRGDSEYGVAPSSLRRLAFRTAAAVGGRSKARPSAHAAIFDVTLARPTKDLLMAERIAVESAAAAASEKLLPAGLKPHYPDGYLATKTALSVITPVVPAGTPAILLVRVMERAAAATTPNVMKPGYLEALARLRAAGEVDAHSSADDHTTPSPQVVDPHWYNATALSEGRAVRPPSAYREFVRLYTTSPLRTGDDAIHVMMSDPVSYTAEFNHVAVECYHGWGTKLVWSPVDVPTRRPNAWRAEVPGSTPGGRLIMDEESPAASTPFQFNVVAHAIAAGTNNPSPQQSRQEETIALVAHRVELSEFADVSTFADFVRALQGDATVGGTGDEGSTNAGDRHHRKRLLLHVKKSFAIPESSSAAAALTIPRGAMIAVAEGVQITVKREVTIDGTAADPVVFTRAAPQKDGEQAFTERSIHSGNWGGIIVSKTGELTVRHGIFAFAGGSSKRPKGTGTHIKDACPVFAVEAKGKLALWGTAVVHSKGPGLGAGAGATVEVRHSFFNDLAQGGECVSCRITIHDTVFANFMLQPASAQFVDRDNDAFYFRGGAATVERATFVNALDDCIDSASSKGDTDKTSLRISDSYIANCVHEGIALSSSVGTDREVRVANSLIGWAQQGVENGHTGSGHQATFSRTSFVGNRVAVRHGDNYKLAIDGSLDIAGAVFLRNGVDVLNEEMPAVHPSQLRAVSDNGLPEARGARLLQVRDSYFAIPTEEQMHHVGRTSLAVNRMDLDGHVKGRFNVKYEADVTRRGGTRLETALEELHGRLSAGFTSALPLTGEVCGQRHFTSTRNHQEDERAIDSLVDEATTTTSDGHGQAGCTVWSECRSLSHH